MGSEQAPHLSGAEPETTIDNLRNSSDDRHALRVSELLTLRWDQMDLKARMMPVARLKNGTPSAQPIRSPELQALRGLQRIPPRPTCSSTSAVAR